MVIAAVWHTKQSMGAVPEKLIEAIGFEKPVVVFGDRAPSCLRDFLSSCPSPYLRVNDETGIDRIASFIQALSQCLAGGRSMNCHEARDGACLSIVFSSLRFSIDQL
jgi:hypothetical protein